MIRKLGIKNFKSHKDTQLDLANLTVLCGPNGVGKSSVLQALLLLRESHFSHSNFEYLDLTSNPVTIGFVKDALYQYGDSNEVEFDIITDAQRFHFAFEFLGTDVNETFIYKSKKAVHSFDKKQLEKESIFNKQFQYISSARFGPLKSYGKDDVVVSVYNQISVMNGQAEHFVHYLYKNKNKIVLQPLLNGRVAAEDLFSQTKAWESEIWASEPGNGMDIIVEDLGNLGYELRYSFDTPFGKCNGNSNGHGKINEFRATNVGFGLTYVLPVIVAILSAQPGALLLIENPEAHLHPHGQSKIAELICLAAQAGVQIILETHSDHIIDGILVQCKKFEEEKKGMDKNLVKIYQFERDEAEQASKVTRVNIEVGGRVRYTPQGFFDQFTIDRKFLMGF